MAAADRTHYDVLGLAPDCDAQEVRAAWKLHVQAWHPDRFSGAMREEAERQTIRINEAYTVLRDGSRRAAYDCRLAVDRADTERARPARRSAPARPPAAVTRAGAMPVGARHVAPVQPMTLSQQAAAMGADAMALVRRHPRVFASAAAVWLLVFAGSAVLHLVAGPSLPSGTGTTAHAAGSLAPAAARVQAEQTEDLEELAEQARREAERADAEMEQLLREDAAAARAADQAAAAAAARAAAADPRAGARFAPRAPRTRPAPGARPPGRRILRVMPKQA